MYRIYLRWHDQRVGEKTTTSDQEIAEASYRTLMKKREYWCSKAAAVLSLDGRQLEFRRFDRIIPLDEHFRKLARENQLPDLPKFIYPRDSAIIPGGNSDMIPQGPREYILCSMDSRLVDALILDDDKPIRMSHDDPAIS